MALAVGVVASVTATVALTTLGHAQAGGLFTAVQATQGQQLFNNYCAECHRPDLTGAAGPALKGATFMAKWGGQPVSNLYGFEHANMPASEPGSMPDSELLPITAFILQQNGLPAGTTALSKDDLNKTLPK